MLAQLGLTPNIEIVTRAQITDCKLEEGKYRIRIRQRPRYVDPAKCVACGMCEEKCPVFETQVSYFRDKKRAAIYLPSMNAVPRGYVIREEACLFFKDGSCRECEKICPKKAINLRQNTKEMELDCQGVILAPGASTFDPHALGRYGYGQFEDVVTNMEFEGLLNPGGPTFGKIKRPSDGKSPQAIAWIQCVGSRQINPVNRPYCSSICCSVAIKQAVTARQLLNPAPKTDIYFIDVRTHQKGAERYFRNARNRGVNFINTRPYGVIFQDGRLAIEAYLPSKGKIRRLYDMIVLSTGFLIKENLKQLAWKFGLETDEFGFNFSQRPEVEATAKRRIFVCGIFNGPKSISGAVTEGSAAAALLRRSFGEKDLVCSKQPAPKPAKGLKNLIHQPPKIGIFVCCCGTNISSIIDTKRLARSFVHQNTDIVISKTLQFSCAPDGANQIEKTIKDMELNRVIIAACSPRSHESVFRQALKKAGIDPSMLVIANIREQVAWVHQKEPDMAYQRAKDQIAMAVEKARALIPYKAREYPVKKEALVLGGGISGMTAAALLAESGIKVNLIERNNHLGGNGLAILKTWRGLKVRDLLHSLEKRLKNNPLVSIYLNATVEDIHGSTGNFTSYIRSSRTTSVDTVEHGVVVLATGAREARPSGFHYGEHPKVLTHQDLDKILMDSGIDGFKQAKNIVFIQCVESCDSKRPYCSRVCCTHSVTRAVYLKELLPHLEIYILYKHMRTYGQRDEYFRQARKMGIKVLRYQDDAPPRLDIVTGIDKNLMPEKRLRLNFFNSLLNTKVVLKPDYLVLASAIEPEHKNNQRLSSLFKLPLGQDGFFQEMHIKLRPCELKRDGFFVAGLAHYPKEVEESISQAAAAAAKAIVFLSKDKVILDRKVARIIWNQCDGCALCIDTCREKAISLCEFIFQGEVKQMAEIDDSLCNGCGSCVGVCPKYAVEIPGYTPQDIMAQINVLLESKHEEK